jgi:hypothetical protein
LNFVKHENFPDAFAKLLALFEELEFGSSSIQTPQDLYGENVKPDEWFMIVGNPAFEHRPVILTMDAGVKENAVSLRMMRDSRCSFVILDRAWWTSVGKTAGPVQSHAWRLLQVWPDVRELIEKAFQARRQCRIDVPLKGRPRVLNL